MNCAAATIQVVGNETTKTANSIYEERWEENREGTARRSDYRLAGIDFDVFSAITAKSAASGAITA